MTPLEAALVASLALNVVLLGIEWRRRRFSRRVRTLYLDGPQDGDGVRWFPLHGDDDAT